MDHGSDSQPNPRLDLAVVGMLCNSRMEFCFHKMATDAASTAILETLLQDTAVLSRCCWTLTHPGGKAGAGKGKTGCGRAWQAGEGMEWADCRREWIQWQWCTPNPILSFCCLPRFLSLDMCQLNGEDPKGPFMEHEAYGRVKGFKSPFSSAASHPCHHHPARYSMLLFGTAVGEEDGIGPSV